MSVRSGFFNSKNGDRKYFTQEVSELFNTLIVDGIFSNYGDLFAVRKGTGMEVIVGSGMGWFLSTWTKNDGDLPMPVADSDPTRGRIDAMVITIDTSDAIRDNSIEIVQGAFNVDPTPPMLADNQRVLAYLTIEPGATSVTSIDMRVGQEDCPFVSGILATVPIDVLWAAWSMEFNTWLEHLKDELDENQAANLQRQIDELLLRLDTISSESLSISEEAGESIDPENPPTTVDAALLSIGRNTVKTSKLVNLASIAQGVKTTEEVSYISPDFALGIVGGNLYNMRDNFKTQFTGSGYPIVYTTDVAISYSGRNVYAYELLNGIFTYKSSINSGRDMGDILGFGAYNFSSDIVAVAFTKENYGNKSIYAYRKSDSAMVELTGVSVPTAAGIGYFEGDRVVIFYTNSTGITACVFNESGVLVHQSTLAIGGVIGYVGCVYDDTAGIMYIAVAGKFIRFDCINLTFFSASAMPNMGSRPKLFMINEKLYGLFHPYVYEISKLNGAQIAQCDQRYYMNLPLAGFPSSFGGAFNKIPTDPPYCAAFNTSGHILSGAGFSVDKEFNIVGMEV